MTGSKKLSTLKILYRKLPDDANVCMRVGKKVKVLVEKKRPREKSLYKRVDGIGKI